jgi:hypothetical protein
MPKITQFERYAFVYIAFYNFFWRFQRFSIFHIVTPNLPFNKGEIIILVVKVILR